MKNEPHVIGDRVPHEHALIAGLKLVVQGSGDQASADITHPAGFARLRAFLGSIGRLVRQRRNRLALLELNDDQLKDIGISRCQAYGDGYSRYRRARTGNGGASI
ncbi:MULTISPECIES: DUF1127 domain-containing protein [unclassified Rhizobium]|uniref:DUF1127 domain-containing protein n=1 Tax=unclassified Rhizobium TaxID=2613769 RepID=UPI0009E6DF09|nr:MULTISPECIES: DUF1127 domain-containing protein [unclassified Rhizobium]